MLQNQRMEKSKTLAIPDNVISEHEHTAMVFAHYGQSETRKIQNIDNLRHAQSKIMDNSRNVHPKTWTISRNGKSKP